MNRAFVLIVMGVVMRRSPVCRPAQRQRLDSRGVERDRNVVRPGVVVDALDQQVQNAGLFEQAERVPDPVECGQRLFQADLQSMPWIGFQPVIFRKSCQAVILWSIDRLEAYPTMRVYFAPIRRPVGPAASRLRFRPR